jgi:hypothetical protein
VFARSRSSWASTSQLIPNLLRRRESGVHNMTQLRYTGSAPTSRARDDACSGPQHEGAKQWELITSVKMDGQVMWVTTATSVIFQNSGVKALSQWNWRENVLYLGLCCYNFFALGHHEVQIWMGCVSIPFSLNLGTCLKYLLSFTWSVYVVATKNILFQHWADTRLLQWPIKMESTS